MQAKPFFDELAKATDFIVSDDGRFLTTKDKLSFGTKGMMYLGVRRVTDTQQKLTESFNFAHSVLLNMVMED